MLVRRRRSTATRLPSLGRLPLPGDRPFDQVAEHVDRLFHGLTVDDPACSLQVSGGINRPPMERGDGTVRLFEQASSLASRLGMELKEASTGGGSDGNFTAGIGIPTLDGMGSVGEGAHAAHESLLLDHLLPRTVLLAAMIASGE